MDKDTQDYFNALAEQLVGSVAASEQISRFTSNRDVVGAFAESLICQFVARIVHPLRISSGTVISPHAFKERDTTPQLDLIVWDPNPIPPIIAEDRFALVPRNSVLGIIEVKKTDYDEGLADIDTKVASIGKCFPDGAPHLFLGVICAVLRHDPMGANKLTELVKKKQTIYLIDYRGDAPRANPEGVYRLVNFLGCVRQLATKREARFQVAYPGATWP
jgi:hypothetical protein